MFLDFVRIIYGDKEYIDFDNKFIDTMENLRKREDISAIFEKYTKHLKLIYDIYSKIGYNKISTDLTNYDTKIESFS